MTIDNPSYDDLLTIAANLKAEGQTSRALLLENAAAELAALEEVKATSEPVLLICLSYARAIHSFFKHEAAFEECQRVNCKSTKKETDNLAAALEKYNAH